MKFLLALSMTLFTFNSVFSQDIDYSKLSRSELQTILGEKKEHLEDLQEKKDTLEKEMDIMRNKSVTYRQENLKNKIAIAYSSLMIVGSLLGRSFVKSEIQYKLVTALGVFHTLSLLVSVSANNKTYSNPMKKEVDELLKKSWDLAVETLLKLETEIQSTQIEIKKINNQLYKK